MRGSALSGARALVLTSWGNERKETLDRRVRLATRGVGPIPSIPGSRERRTARERRSGRGGEVPLLGGVGGVEESEEGGLGPVATADSLVGVSGTRYAREDMDMEGGTEPEPVAVTAGAVPAMSVR